jgi:hypothetical protein
VLLGKPVIRGAHPCGINCQINSTGVERRRNSEVPRSSRRPRGPLARRGGEGRPFIPPAELGVFWNILIKEYPFLKGEDIRAALFYAERVLEEEEIFSFDGMSGVKPGKKSTPRLPGLKAWACLRRELSRTLRVDPERRFFTPLKRRGLPSTRAQAEGAPPNGSNR